MAKELLVSVLMEEGEPLGAVPNDKLVIIQVQPNTAAEGKLMVGDQVLKVNGVVVQNTNHFFKLLRIAPPIAQILIVRDENKAVEMQSRCHIPSDRMKLVTPRDGYSYFLARLTWKPNGPKLGLGIKHYQNRVLVSRCDPNSVASQMLQVGDHLIDVDGIPVTDKEVCRGLLMKNLQAQNFATSVVERAESLEAKQWVQNALFVSIAHAPSVAMNSDVREIAARQRARLKMLPLVSTV